jgi:imidazolonepropionase-like amidohydrolase
MRNMKTHTKFLISMVLAFSSITTYSQVYQFKDGNWFINGAFTKATFYTVNGYFTKEVPQKIDSVIDLKNKYCIPPFGDAHTHNLDGEFNLKEMVANYLRDGIFYVQVLGNNGEGSKAARPILAKSKKIDATYANGLLTSTYGHGFFPYEPLAMGIYAPYLQRKYADSIKKSRLVENKSYYFLDTKKDVDEKWSLIMKYQPDHIKICLNDAKNYPEKRRLEIADDNGLSEEVAAYVVQKSHQQGLRVFAHVETADDARICAKIGVDALAHLPGYYWDGRDATKEKYCMTKSDIKLFKNAGLTIIPTVNIDGSTKFDTLGKPTYNYTNFLATLDYKKKMLKAMHEAKVPIAFGADYYGKTVTPEIDSLIKNKYFSNKDFLTIYAVTTPKSIFPKRKIGEIKEGYEASFLILNENPLLNIEAIKKISYRIKQGKFINLL